MKGVDAYTRGDYQTAFSEFKALAEQNHMDAQNNLGVMYNTGRGVAQDNAEAARWYRRAAERGHLDAQNNLAALYVSGKGVPQDYVMAYAWFNLAAAQGDQSARQNRDFIAQRMSSEQISRAQQLNLLTPPTAGIAPAPTPPSSTSAPAPTPPRPVQAPPPTPPSPAPAAASTSTGNVYGPVAPGTTLWSIAQSIANQQRPSGSVSTQQVMLALWRINPQAFSRPDINSLKVGAMLRIPDTTEITRISKTQAQSEVRRQLGQ